MKLRGPPGIRATFADALDRMGPSLYPVIQTHHWPALGREPLSVVCEQHIVSAAALNAKYCNMRTAYDVTGVNCPISRWVGANNPCTQEGAARSFLA